MRKVAIDKVYELACRDERVVFIGSDLGAGILANMKAEMPDRFFMEGVSEAHVIGMAAGLAFDGYIPYVNTIATFLTRRCYEQTAIDLCLHRLPVRLLASGGGVVYAPLGPTHMATDDIALMRSLPNMTVTAPVDAVEMGHLMDASLAWPGPMYIRLAKGGDPIITRPEQPLLIGTARTLRAGGTVLLIGTGILSCRALQASDLLAKWEIDAGVIHLHTIKPLDEETIVARAREAELVITLEEHSLIGGLGSAVAEVFADRGVMVPLMRRALPDAFSHAYGSQDQHLATAGLTAESIAQAARDALRRRFPAAV